jgi:very-short-patch-repair endonuclease
MSATEKKKCGARGCKYGDNEQPLSEFKSKTGKITGTCKDCREKKAESKAKSKERDKIEQKCNEEGLSYEEELKKAGLEIPSKRIENKIIDGVEYAWCSGHKSYQIATNFAKADVKQHFNGLRSTCKECNKDERVSSLDYISEKIKCEQCDDIVMRRSMRDHILNKHTSKENTYIWKCETCQITLKHEHLLEKHKETEGHKIKERASSISNSKINLMIKFKTKGELNTENIISDSNKKVSNNEILSDEPTITNDIELRPFVCNKMTDNEKTCNKNFKTNSDLEKHISRCHLNIFYECTYLKCDKKFRRNDMLTRHIKEVHSKSPAKYKCNICKISVIARGEKRHLQSCIRNVLTKGYPGNSINERTATMFFCVNNIDYLPQKKFDDLKKISNLIYDYYLADYNMLIEVQGGYHTRKSGHSNADKILETNIENDSIKRNYAIKNGYRFFAYDAEKYRTYNQVANLLANELQLENAKVFIDNLDEIIKARLNGHGNIEDFFKESIILPSNVFDKIYDYLY